MSLTRRLFLGRTASAGAALAVVPAPVIAEAVTTTDLTAIPTDVADRISDWHAAHRRSVAASTAYSASLQAKPIDKAECDRRFIEFRDACEEVPPLREAMIVALLSLNLARGPKGGVS